MKYRIILLLIMVLSGLANKMVCQSDTTKLEIDYEKKDPFAWADWSWLQGNSRINNQILGSKYFTGDITMDINYNYHFANPIDHTQTGSTATFRTNEINVSYIEAGGDFHDPKSGARGRLMLQFGTRAIGVPRNDNTGLRGQWDLYNAYRYVTEGYVGIHLKKMHGINIDVGIFKSYVGLMGYNNFENWNYQNSFTSDNTPWFFTGIRIQTFPTQRLKLEYWLVNGWQTYSMANGLPGFGFQMDYRPESWIKILSSIYVGWDTPNNKERLRFHNDNSIIVKTFERKFGLITKGAFSITGDIGFEHGGGVVAFNGDAKTPSQYFLSYMVYHRLWLGSSQKWGWTIGGGQLTNPGRYLSLVPPGIGSQPIGAGNVFFTQNPGDVLKNWDISTTIQYMPNDHVTWGLEYVERHSNIGYFPGSGGVTSPNGWNSPIGNPVGFIPDLRKSERRIIASIIVRF